MINFNQQQQQQQQPAMSYGQLGGGGGGGQGQLGMSGFGGGGGGSQGEPTLGMTGYGGGNQGSSSQSISQGGSYFSNPDLVNNLAGALGGTATQASQQYLPFATNPMGNPIFQQLMQGLLGGLEPSENAARTNLLDQFRSAGMMSSGIFGNQATNLESELMRNRGELASKTLMGMYPQITQALGMPMQQIDPLIQALKLQQDASHAQSTGASPQKSGGNFMYTGGVGANAGLGGIQKF